MENDKSEINFEIFKSLNPKLIDADAQEKIKTDIEEIYQIYNEIKDKDIEK